MEHRRTRSRRRSQGTDDRGLSLLVTVISLLVTVISLLVTALLVLFALKATTSSNSMSTPGTMTPTAAADATQAQQNLSAAVSTAGQTDVAGQGSLDAATLQAADPSLVFTPGPSTGPGTVSVTAAPDGSGVTLVTRSGDGTCWAVWWSPRSATWYGAQTGQASCTAPALSAAPSAGPVSSAAIGWQQGSFPTA